jgi:hypothetical protein
MMSNKVEVADEAATVIVAHPDFDPLENDRLYCIARVAATLAVVSLLR